MANWLFRTGVMAWIGQITANAPILPLLFYLNLDKKNCEQQEYYTKDRDNKLSLYFAKSILEVRIPLKGVLNS